MSLIKHFAEIRVTFSPFNPTAKSARYVFTLFFQPFETFSFKAFLHCSIFLSRFMTNRNRSTNTNLKITPVILSDPDLPPTIYIAYRTSWCFYLFVYFVLLRILLL